jgi:hypothetical protein
MINMEVLSGGQSGQTHESAGWGWGCTARSIERRGAGRGGAVRRISSLSLRLAPGAQGVVQQWARNVTYAARTIARQCAVRGQDRLESLAVRISRQPNTPRMNGVHAGALQTLRQARHTQQVPPEQAW